MEVAKQDFMPMNFCRYNMIPLMGRNNLEGGGPAEFQESADCIEPNAWNPVKAREINDCIATDTLGFLKGQDLTIEFTNKGIMKQLKIPSRKVACIPAHGS
jgi:hypothetical protein